MIDLVLTGLLLVLVGFGMIAIAMLTQGERNGTVVKGGGVVMIGPIPIVIGSDMKWASVAIALAIILILLVVVLGLE